MEVTIDDGSAAAAAEFMAVEWPPYNAAHGIEWVPQDILLIANPEQPIGVACGTVVGGVGELKQILVKSGTDKRGVGSQLLAEFERRCRTLSCHKLRLETADFQARPFYEKHGFAVAVTLTNDRFGRDVFVMEKRLG
jgi:GNAT superfamily N-acetyltransferase